jgi:shikimate dehydrogenase
MKTINPQPPSFLIGLIGAGIQASRSPAMHIQEGAAQGLRYFYQLIDLEELGLGTQALPELLSAAERMGFCGLNITHPCKQAVLPLLNDLSNDARALGAVNTVLLRDGRRMGHNTDWWGFAESFRHGMADAKMDRIVQLGAGGGGAAVAYAALSLGAGQLSLFDLDPSRAQQLAGRLAAKYGASRIAISDDLQRAMAEADGLIHATPSGMVKHPGLPLPREMLRADLWVAEIVYFPLETELLRVARQIGCCTLDGSGMAVFQAAEAFRLFTGIPADAQRMWRQFVAMGD